MRRKHRCFVCIDSCDWWIWKKAGPFEKIKLSVKKQALQLRGRSCDSRPKSKLARWSSEWIVSCSIAKFIRKST